MKQNYYVTEFVERIPNDEELKTRYHKLVKGNAPEAV